MSMNIKNAEAHQLARESAVLTGESMTAAVTVALRERLERIRRERDTSLADRLLAMADKPRRISTSRIAPSSMGICSMTGADCLGDRRHVGAHRDPARASAEYAPRTEKAAGTRRS